MKFSRFFTTAALALAVPGVAAKGPCKEAKDTFDSWTGERIINAIPRDFVIEEEGNGFHLRSLKTAARDLQLSEGIWNDESALVAETAGRIIFQMGRSDFVCSGTAVTDGTSGRSVIITAAHCVYDDTNKRFANNVIFIPNQDESTRASDRNCNNDEFGCWRTGFGVVDANWASRTWPNNQRWDYAFYVVEDQGEHLGADSSVPDALDQAVTPIDVSFNRPNCDSLSMIGYSFNVDPNMEYCVQPQGENRNGYQLANCLLGQGSSGGPSMCGSDEGNGPIVSVVSYSFQQRFSGVRSMGGPLLHSNSAECLFAAAKSSSFTCGDGVVVSFNENTGSCTTDCASSGGDAGGSGTGGSGGSAVEEPEGSLTCTAIPNGDICAAGAGCPAFSEEAGDCCACARVRCGFWGWLFPQTYCVGVWN